VGSEEWGVMGQVSWIRMLKQADKHRCFNDIASIRYSLAG
jgi:hypothetical protein